MGVLDLRTSDLCSIQIIHSLSVTGFAKLSDPASHLWLDCADEPYKRQSQQSRTSTNMNLLTTIIFVLLSLLASVFARPPFGYPHHGWCFYRGPPPRPGKFQLDHNLSFSLSCLSPSLWWTRRFLPWCWIWTRLLWISWLNGNKYLSSNYFLLLFVIVVYCLLFAELLKRYLVMFHWFMNVMHPLMSPPLAMSSSKTEIHQFQETTE